jgi:hypothetical protein
LIITRSTDVATVTKQPLQLSPISLLCRRSVHFATADADCDASKIDVWGKMGDVIGDGWNDFRDKRNREQKSSNDMGQPPRLTEPPMPSLTKGSREDDCGHFATSYEQSTFTIYRLHDEMANHCLQVWTLRGFDHHDALTQQKHFQMSLTGRPIKWAISSLLSHRECTRDLHDMMTQTRPM